MSFSIPPSQAKALVSLAKCPEEVRKAVYEALSAVPVQLFPWGDMEAAIEGATLDSGIDGNDLARAVFQMHVGLCRNRPRSDRDFVDSLVSALLAQEEGADESKLQAMAVNLLGISSVSLAARATKLHFEASRHLHDVLILSDLRPVFDHMGSDVDAFLITHTLKLATSGGDEKESELFVVLDDEDIDKLEEAIARARRKALALKAIASATGKPIVGEAQ